MDHTNPTRHMPQFAAVRASFLSALVARIEANGRSAQPLLNRYGIGRGQFHDPYSAVPMKQFVALLEGAAAVAGDPILGARIGFDIKAGDMGPVGIVLSLSANIATGIERFVRYTNALQSSTESSWARSGDEWILSYRIADDTIWPRRQDAEFSMASLTQVIRDSFHQRWSPVEVHFEHPAPDDDSLLRGFFRCPVRFAQSTNRLVVDADSSSTPYRKEDTALLAALERHIGDLLGVSPPTRGLRGAVASVMEANLGISPVTLDRVSLALRMSPRTLQRRLASEGTSIRRILDDYRRTRAGVLLSQPDATVVQVAQALGYSDPTAFWRAYRNWTGEAPTDAQRRISRA